MNAPENPRPSSGDDSASNTSAAANPLAAMLAAAATGTGGGVSFQFVFNNVTYNLTVNAPDATTGAYGFTVTKGTAVIASLIYKSDVNWQIAVGLPTPFVVDPNLTLNAFSVNIQHGSVS